MGCDHIAFLKKKKKTDTKEVKESKTLVRTITNHFSRGDYTLYNSEIIFSAVGRISNALSAMPIQLYQNLTPVNDDLNDILRYDPNPNMTSCNFFKTLEACRCTSGNAYALKIVNANFKIERIDIIDPSQVMPCLDEESNEVWYRIQTPQKELIVHNYYVLHTQFVSTGGVQGVNPVSVLFNTLNYSENIQKFSVDQLKKGINAAVVLEAPANLGEKQKEKMVESFLEAYKKTGGNIILLESGVTAKSMNLSPVDTKLFEVEKITRSKVAMVYNIPPHLLGDYSATSFSSMEQQMLEFLGLTMLPIVTMYEQELNKKFLTPEQRKKGYNFKFDMNAMLRADASTSAEVNHKAVRSAWKTPNEIRAEYGRPPIENGEKLLISRDLIPLDITVTRTELLLGKEKKQVEQTMGNQTS